MKISLMAVLVGFAISAGSTFALAAGGDAKAGKEKSALCQGCHGEKGVSADPTFPNLAGQFAGYIEKQVTDFQQAKRENETMSPMAATVTSKQDLKDIAAYFAAQKPVKGKGSSGSKAAAGKKIYMKGNPKTGVYGCKNCHGDTGKGRSANNPLFPVISGQHKAYTIAQLTNMKTGKRSNDPAGMMSNIAKLLSTQEIEAVAEYVSGL
ncbi:MAG: cytochrome c4 [Gammaproteobacteria bacterium]|nr:cytochrome c4 [Gammaproteobacteria bacterium]